MTSTTPNSTTRKRSLGSIHGAEYNPRLMPAGEMAALRRSLREFGLVQLPLVRAEDGLLVGGHQRLAALRANLAEDGLSPEDIDDTKITVMEVRGLDDARTKALNVALNRIHGEWDTEKLGTLLEEITAESVDPTLTGFSDAEVTALLSEVARSSAQAPTEGTPAGSPSSEWKGMPEAKNEDKTSHSQLIVHFKSAEDEAKFLALVGSPVVRGGINGSRTVWYPYEAERTVGIFSDREYASTE